jgi:polyisoprenoid-binding protein YceI
MQHAPRSTRSREPLSRLLIAGAALVLGLSLATAACDDPTKGQAKASAAAAVASNSAPAAAGTTFVINPTNSQIAWTGSKVTGKHDGSFGSFSGTITLVEGKVERSRVTVDIDTPSLTTVPENLVHHLKTADFFNIEQFPKASFASTSIAPIAGATGEKPNYQITGNLTLHGTTKSISFPANIQVQPDTIVAEATFSINRKDFAINYPGKVDDVIRDDVLIRLSLHAAKQS